MMRNYVSHQESSKNAQVIKIIMKTLDKTKQEHIQQIDTNNESIISLFIKTICEILKLSYDFVKRLFIYYGKPILHNSFNVF